MKNIIFYIISLGSFLIFSPSRAQQASLEEGDFGKVKNITTSSPTTSALGTFGDYSVNKVYGLPEINFPLISYSTGALKQDISIGYHAGGVKVRDKAGWTGLGWSLFAGGAVTSQVNGVPDLYGYFANVNIIPNAYEDLFSQLSNPSTSQLIYSFVNSVASGDKTGSINSPYSGFDLQPDLYNISADNFSGNYVFNSSWLLTSLDGSLSLKAKALCTDVTGGNLNTTTRLSIDGFQVTDKDGKVYVFGKTTTSTEMTTSYSDYSSAWEALWYPHISAWYLTKIVAPNKTDSILFNYEADVTIIDSAYMPTVYSTNNVCPKTAVFQSWQMTQTATVKLSSIVYATGKIVFSRSTYNSWDDSRLDYLIQYQLENDKSYTQIKRVDFTYDFFVNKDKSKSLRLLNITLQGTTPDKQVYGFEYNPLQLPGRKSNDIDHWGYYNGANNPGPDPLVCGLCPVVTVGGITLGNGNREPNISYTQACVIKKVSYPTGGSTVFTFQNHQDDASKVYGGLRINQIQNFADPTSTIPSTVKSYNYTGGYTIGYSAANLFDYYKSYSRACGGCAGGAQVYYVNETALYSNPIGVSQSPSVLAYTQVTESNLDPITSASLGKTTYGYNSRPDVTLDHRSLFQSYKNIREQLASLKIYDNNNNLINETDYAYTRLPDVPIAPGLAITRASFPTTDCPHDLSSAFHTEDFDFLQCKSLLTSKTESLYTSAGPVVNTTSYFYSTASDNDAVYSNPSWHPFPIRIVTTNSNNDNLTTIRRYPLDFSIKNAPDPIYNQLHTLKDSHIISALINEFKLVNNNVVKGTIMEYNDVNPINAYSLETTQPVSVPSLTDNSVPSAIIPPEITSLIKPSVNFSWAFGRLQSQNKANGVLTTYQWGYANNSLLVSETINATSYESAYEGYEYAPYAIASIMAHTGKYCVSLSQNQTTASMQKYNIRAGQYIFSAWVNSTGNGYIDVVDLYNRTNNIQQVLPNTNGNWQYVEVRITATSGSNLQTTIANNTGGQLYVDDVRFQPALAMMKTYTYDPAVGVTSITDENSITTYYVYDTMNRLIAIKDANRNDLKTMSYKTKD